MRPIRRFIIHHSASRDGHGLSWGDIRREHTMVRRFDDIGYHFGIEWIQADYEIVKGRPVRFEGAHCKGANGDSIGICLVGNFNEGPPHKDQLAKLRELLRDLSTQFDLPLDSQTVLGHGELARTDCPGKQFSMIELRASLRAPAGEAANG